MMKLIKMIFKTVSTRIWFIVSVISIVLFTIVTALSLSVYSEVISMALGGDRILGRGSDKYFAVEATSKEDAYARGNDLNELLCEEGFVLLKNDGSALPLAADEKKISVFGKNSVNLVYGGTGSAGGNYDGAATIKDSLEKAGFEVNPKLWDFYLSDKSGSGRTPNPKIENSGEIRLETGETPQDKYGDVASSYAQYNDAAIVVFSRIGGEGFDLPRTMQYDSSKHYLELDSNERALLDMVTSNFGKVIVVLNCSTTMEIKELKTNADIDACIAIGGPGFSGINALGRLLGGEVTFSGKTVDIWTNDFTKNPTWANFGNNASENGAAYYTLNDEKRNDLPYYFVDYEEGIYLGYRYYETRGFESEAWYSQEVAYPFGYGLSYTDFDWSIENAAELKNLAITDGNKNNEIEIKVKVTNVGKYKGKDVVELFCNPPQGSIEKSATTLVAFEKTPTLYPAANKAAVKADAANSADKPNSAVITLKFNPYYAASYDYSDANGNGIKGYELEAGDYALVLKTDSHTPKNAESINFSVASGVAFDTDKVKNRFDDASSELDRVLSRNDWTGTWPTTPDGHNIAEADFTVTDITSVLTNNPNTDWETFNTGVPSNKKIVEMRGKAYDDGGWDEILNSLTFDELKDLFNKGAFKTVGIPHLGLPETIMSDGPMGFSNFISSHSVYGTVSYANEYVIGSTWSKELARRFGETVGEEASYGKQNFGERTPYSGWYAPGMNLHRSPFGGRNGEYFSEDPYLTGMLAAAQIEGVQSKGVIPFMKHFALNEQETHRDDNGLLTFATEQAIRELYLRPFEIAVKTADARGVMSSFNRIGTRWTGGDYRLLTEVLREEWGFKGAVISDFNVEVYMNAKQMVYAGGDLNLTATRPWISADAAKPSDVAVLRKAAHNVLYAVVNSNAMDGITPKTSLRSAVAIWKICLIVVDCIILASMVVWGVFVFIKLKKNYTPIEFDVNVGDNASGTQGPDYFERQDDSDNNDAS